MSLTSSMTAHRGSNDMRTVRCQVIQGVQIMRAEQHVRCLQCYLKLEGSATLCNCSNPKHVDVQCVQWQTHAHHTQSLTCAVEEAIAMMKREVGVGLEKRCLPAQHNCSVMAGCSSSFWFALANVRAAASSDGPEYKLQRAPWKSHLCATDGECSLRWRALV